MEEAILVINAGSSSIKFAIFVLQTVDDELRRVYRGEIAGIGKQARLSVLGAHDDTLLSDEMVTARTHDEAFVALWLWIDVHISQYHLVAAGHRVLHGGLSFFDPVVVNEQVMAKLNKLVPLAPLHQPHNLAGIEALSRIRPELAQVACFDTAFHRTIPAVAQTFALPRALTIAGVQRYGFHGLSYEYIANVLPEFLGNSAEGRVIVAHLGHGASMCAMRGRKSIATTMSFTPLDGLPMGTRSGSIDPAVILYLMREKGMDVDAVSDLLHFQSGLYGVSGVSGDMRELLTSPDSHAAEAIDLFVYWVTRALGSLAAVLGGLDALVFTAGIGEHAAEIRQRICRDAAWLGVQLDTEANAMHRPRISTADSAVTAWVIPTDEERVIAQHTAALVGAGTHAETD